jgi:hypothetical protein
MYFQIVIVIAIDDINVHRHRNTKNNDHHVATIEYGIISPV